MQEDLLSGTAEGYNIPQNFLDRINEHCLGGFVLFTFDENGFPKVYSESDSLITFRALKDHVCDWSDAIRQFSIDQITDSMEENLSDEEDEDEEDRNN